VGASAVENTTRRGGAIVLRVLVARVGHLGATLRVRSLNSSTVKSAQAAVNRAAMEPTSHASVASMELCHCMAMKSLPDRDRSAALKVVDPSRNHHRRSPSAESRTPIQTGYRKTRSPAGT